MSAARRVILGLLALSLLLIYYFPFWKIQLWAPQYPEGLKLLIGVNDLSGDIAVINGLNHYIGMRELHATDFPEFRYLPFIIGFFIAAGLVTALLGKKSVFRLFAWSYILFGILAMVDFYRWEYSYGHDLNPHAPIKVPGMAYQPPFIGYKQMLNFEALSLPDISGMIFAAGGFLLFFLLVFDFLKKRKMKLTHSTTGTAFALLAIILTAFSCTKGPRPLKYGQDACDHCRMTLVDTHFGAELLTSTGKSYVFDDVNCCVQFIHAHESDVQVQQVYVIDHSHPSVFLEATAAQFLSSGSLRTPMNSGIAVYPAGMDLTTEMIQFPGTVITWEQVNNQFSH